MPESIRLRDVPAIVEAETGWRPTRQTVYGWANRNWLATVSFRPLRTTYEAIMACLAEHKGTN